MMFEDGADLGEEVGALELLDGSASFGGDADEAQLGAALIPIGYLLDAGLFEVVWQRRDVTWLIGARKQVTAGVGDPA